MPAILEVDSQALAEPADIAQSRDRPFPPNHPKLQIYGLNDRVVCYRAIGNRCSALPAPPSSLPAGANETLTPMFLPTRTFRSPARQLLCHTWCGGISEKLGAPWTYPSEVLPSYHLPCLQVGHLISSLKASRVVLLAPFPPPELLASLLGGLENCTSSANSLSLEGALLSASKTPR